MPRLVIFLFFLSFLVIGMPKNVQASLANQTLYIKNTNNQFISLPDNSFKIDFFVNSLTHSSRVNIASISSQNVQNRPQNLIGDIVYSWQILDAQINIPAIAYIDKPVSEKTINVLTRSNNHDRWRNISYEVVGGKIKLQIYDSFGQIALIDGSGITLQPISRVLDKSSVDKGYQVADENNTIIVHVLPKMFRNKVIVNITPLSSNLYPIPNKLDLISDIYYVNIATENNESITRDLPIDIKYFNDNIKNKNIYYWDGINWQLSPSKTNYHTNTVRTFTHQKDVILAVFSDEIMAKGKASWYRWKHGDFAASPDYAKGTKLRVTNLDNDKYVIVEVNDFGPDRSVYPDRVIDLDRVAFAKIANPSLGIISVSVERVF